MTRIIAFVLFLATWNVAGAQVGSFGEAGNGATGAPPDFNGVWLAAPGTIGGVEFAEMAGGAEPPQLTAEALRIREDYDFLVDDPAYLCSPASLTRVWSNPVPIEIEQHTDRVILRYEYMDGLRTVYLDGRSRPPEAPRDVLGHSIGRYEGSTLVIESTDFTSSYIGAITGTPQTETLRVVERLTLSEDGQRFRLEIIHEDPATFTSPWTPTRVFVLTDLERLDWDCVLEDAGYAESTDSSAAATLD
jgi:hypothetical protein